MIELITDFLAGGPKRTGGLTQAPQAGRVEGQYLVRSGACNLCGKCCNNIYLLHDEDPIQDEAEFAELQQRNPEYVGFMPISKDEHGLRFACKHLQPDNRCGIYQDRPSFCQQYPSEKGILLGGQLAEGCGYSFAPWVTFQETLATLAKHTQ